MDYDRLAKMLGKALSKGEEVEDTARTIKASQNIEDLTGKGTEYLLSPEGEVRARFTDGNMVPNPVGSNEPTVGSAIPGLPMDEASRMARAREMGFNPDQTLYHGTTANFDSFQPSPADRFVGPGVYFATDPRNARGSLDGAGSNIIPAYARGNIFEWPQKPVSDKYSTEIHDNIAKYLGYNSVDDLYKGMRTKYPEAWEGGQPIHVAIQNELKNQGYTGVNFGPGSGSFQQTVMFDPKDIRSKFAAFDPAQANSSNLSAGLAGAALGAGALGAATLAPQDAQANEETEAASLLQRLAPTGPQRWAGKTTAMMAGGMLAPEAKALAEDSAPIQSVDASTPLHYISKMLDTADKYSARPVRAAAQAALSGTNPLSAAANSITQDKDVSGGDVAHAFLQDAEGAGMPLRAPGQAAYPSEPFVGAAAGTILDPVQWTPLGRIKTMLGI